MEFRGGQRKTRQASRSLKRPEQVNGSGLLHTMYQLWLVNVI
jgi:hypothetical protein